MGLQKYRANIAFDPDANGAVAYSARWLGGPSLSLVRNCPTDDPAISPRTVYVTGEPDTWFSHPAACKYRGKTVRGWLGMNDGNWIFHTYKDA